MGDTGPESPCTATFDRSVWRNTHKRNSNEINLEIINLVLPKERASWSVQDRLTNTNTQAIWLVANAVQGHQVRKVQQ
jgi:hypothetical protein